MKKLVLTAAVVACAASMVSAQTVTSANIVGYTKVQAIGSQLTLCALNFDTGGATLQDLIGTSVPNLSAVYVWNKDTSTYAIATLGTRGSWSPNLVINLGDALWVEPAGTGTNEIVFSGEVLTTDIVHVVPAGLLMTGYGYPVETDFTTTQMASDVANLSAAYFWNESGQNYTVITKGTRGSWSGTAVIGPSDGFWIENAGSEVSVDEPVPFAP